LRQLLTTFLSNGQEVGWKKRFQNDLFSVKRGVKPLTQSINQAVNHLNDFGAAYCSFLEHTPRCCLDGNPDGSVNIQYGSSSYGTCRKRRRPSVISGFGHDRFFSPSFPAKMAADRMHPVSVCLPVNSTPRNVSTTSRGRGKNLGKNFSPSARIGSGLLG